MAIDSADVTSSGRSFQVCGSATGKAWLPIGSLLIGTTRRLVCFSLISIFICMLKNMLMSLKQA